MVFQRPGVAGDITERNQLDSDARETDRSAFSGSFLLVKFCVIRRDSILLLSQVLAIACELAFGLPIQGTPYLC